MKILNQSKTAIINTDMCLAILIPKTNDNRVVAITPKYNLECPHSIVLGEYKTHNRAKEVLKDIINNVGKNTICYTMPKTYIKE